MTSPAPNPRSPRDIAAAEFRNTVGTIYLIAAISGAISLLDFVFDLLPEGLGLTSLIAAPIYGALGLWVQRQRSILGLGVTLGLYIAHCLAFLWQQLETYQTGDRVPIALIVSGLAGIYLLFQGFRAIKRLKSAQVDDDSASG